MKKIFYILSILLLSNCNSIEKDYKKAVKDNSIDSYNEFIDKHKDHSLADTALAKIEYLSFQTAIKSNNADSIRAFLNNYPVTKYEEKAIYYLDSLLFDIALKYNSADSIENFIKRYNKSHFLAQAEKKIEEMIYINAIKNNSVNELKLYIKKYPKGTFIKDAKTQLLILKYSVPELKENQIWITSIPVGLKVYISNNEEDIYSNEDKLKGRTPYIMDLNPDNIYLAICLDDADKLSGDIYSISAEKVVNQIVVKDGKGKFLSYKIYNLKDYKDKILISLFHFKQLSLNQMSFLYPQGKYFEFDKEFARKEILENSKLSSEEIDLVIDLLSRGGKVFLNCQSGLCSIEIHPDGKIVINQKFK